MDDLDAVSIPEFCRRHSLSRSAFYNALRAGEGPALMRVGSRVMISREAATRWRQAREQAASQAAAP